MFKAVHWGKASLGSGFVGQREVNYGEDSRIKFSIIVTSSQYLNVDNYLHEFTLAILRVLMICKAKTVCKAIARIVKTL